MQASAGNAKAEIVKQRTLRKYLQRCHLRETQQQPGGLMEEKVIEIMTVGNLGLGEWISLLSTGANPRFRTELSVGGSL